MSARKPTIELRVQANPITAIVGGQRRVTATPNGGEEIERTVTSLT